jgi:hypothetical protein
MQDLSNFLKERFGASQVEILNRNGNSFHLITLPGSKELRILMSVGLSDHQMKVHEKHMGEEWKELYFLIPSYWNLLDEQDENMNWVFHWLTKLKNYVVSKDTWLGHGHTIPTGKELAMISPNMKQNHFILSDPLELEDELKPIAAGDKTIYFLALIPIFADEMDYKQGKGTAKLFAKFAQQNITEKLDDFRSTVLKTRWNFFAK